MPPAAPEAAAAELSRLAERFPDDWMVAHLDALHRSRGATPEDAIALWDRVAAMDPPMPHPYVERAKAHARAGHVQAAYDDACRAIDLAPSEAWSYTARAIYGSHLDHEDTRVTADFDRGVELAPNELFARYHRGSWREGLGDLAGAVDDFDAAIASAPTFAKLYFERGSCRVRIGPEDDSEGEERRQAQIEASVADLEKALELGYEDDGELFFELYLFHTELDDDDAAASALERGMAIAPGSAALYYARSEMREAAGDAPGAAADRARATELGWSSGS
jgi:tetratricopeptide (TPR) repeat protein